MNKENKTHLQHTALILLAAWLAAALVGCGAPAPPEDVIPEPVEETEPAAQPETDESAEEPAEQSAEEAAQSATYTVAFNATWSAETHPDQYPSNAHFSPLIAYGYSGAPDARMFTVGASSSLGMEQMAETGATGILEEEIQSIIASGGAYAYVKGSVFDSPGSDQVELSFTQEHSHLIFVSMIAPSPDWFVTAETALFENGQWVNEKVLEVVSYDAGTDSGAELTSADSDTNPKEAITLFPDYLKKLGNLTLTLNSAE